MSANTGKYFWGIIFETCIRTLAPALCIGIVPVFAHPWCKYIKNILGELISVQIHAAHVFTPGRIQENTPGELFMYCFRARGVHFLFSTNLKCKFFRSEGILKIVSKEPRGRVWSPDVPRGSYKGFPLSGPLNRFNAILSLLQPIDRYRTPSAIGSAIGRPLSRPISHLNTSGSPQPPYSKPLAGLNRAIVVL